MQAVAEGAIQQRKEEVGVMDSYFNSLQKAIASIPTDGTQFGERLKSCCESNIAIARDYMHKMTNAGDFREVLRIQVDFAHAQFNAFSGQARSLSEAYNKTATDASLAWPVPPTKTRSILPR